MIDIVTAILHVNFSDQNVTKGLKHFTLETNITKFWLLKMITILFGYLVAGCEKCAAICYYFTF